MAFHIDFADDIRYSFCEFKGSMVKSKINKYTTWEYDNKKLYTLQIQK